ncbi:SpoIIE-like protein phosphatase domain protein [Leptospira inadai serovar Lyme str. 10]|uniref:SpoIIE-like protein phosphatase domain protein n=2 Tax=Leptospira inadai serovar Lyme TaxID=293084 RepID=V6HK08_9LEPT|nr:PP2C family protein-serine/threonine phosphatase [Leptospira inadai]EQA37225.1 SpoIIE-like protein phosphatase domain protein [Leptospira inadai serovar Lyme str. 10]PNV73298.1 stage II sporulation protein E [Leptospira inadai serovar Lyme]
MLSQEQSFQKFVWTLEKKWIQIVCVLGFTLVPIFGGLDYFIIPREYLDQNLTYFLTLRAVASIIVLIQFIILKYSDPNPWNAIHAYVFTFVVGGIISLMTTRLGGFESSYYAGLNLVLIAVNLFLPWNALKGSLNSMIIVVQYVILNLIFDKEYQVISIINNLYFMLGTIIISVTIAHFKFTLTKSEFEKMDLISNLKSQQDGDYFLTSLVLQPLSLNLAKSESIHIEFYTSQKKKFVFKTWKQEIGGDICVSNVITLKGKTYVVFVNADAMGKSLQGAGGAIVFGAVFHAMVQRTKMMEVLQNQYPERWLKNAVIELQKTFESFDGAMMISMVIGLADEELGLVYYINAEHPFPVLYRDGKAIFLDSQMYFRKVGMLELKSKLFVSLFQMEPGDSIILGSDGREDLMVFDPGINSKTMVEDENFFLDKVEKGKGEINGIVSELQNSGDIIDDLSLLKITYQPKYSRIGIDAQNGNGKSSESFSSPHLDHPSEKTLDSLKHIVSANLKDGDLSKAIQAAKEIVRISPIESNYLYFLAKNLNKIKNYKDSIEYGERFRYRNPSHVNNLIVLSDSYRRTGDTKRSELLLRDVFSHEPENAIALNLLGRLKTHNGKNVV